MASLFNQLLACRFLYTFAVQIQGVVLGWQMYILTKDPLALGLVGLAEAVPALGLAPYAGYAVDRGSPIRAFRRMLELSLLSGFILLLSQAEPFHLERGMRIAGLFLSSMLTGAARAFSQPSIYAIVPRIIQRSQFSRASAWMSTSLQIGRVSGPAAGGLLFAWQGTFATSLLVCVILIASIGTAVALERSGALGAASPDAEPPKRDLLSGARFVFNNPVLLSALSLDMISVLFGGVTALLPIYAAEILMTDAKGLGMLRAAPAIGAALMSIVLISVDLRTYAGRWLIAAVTGFGICILTFAMSRSFTVSIVALALSGSFDSISVVVRSSAVQLLSPDSMRGQISAVNSIFIGSSNEIGEFESGVLARFAGTVPAAVIGGVLCLGTVFAVSVFCPALRRLNLRELEHIHHASVKTAESPAV